MLIALAEGREASQPLHPKCGGFFIWPEPRLHFVIY